jgi:hypothetical protein
MASTSDLSRLTRDFKAAAEAGNLTTVKRIYQSSSSDLAPFAIQRGFFKALRKSKFRVVDYIFETILPENPDAMGQIRINLDEEIDRYLVAGRCDSLYYLISHHLTDYDTVTNKITSLAHIPKKSEKGKNISRCSLYLELAQDRDETRAQMGASNGRYYR